MGESVQRELPPQKEFVNVGTVRLASSGRSLVIEINLNSYYVSREQVMDICHGRRKDATVSLLRMKGG